MKQLQMKDVEKKRRNGRERILTLMTLLYSIQNNKIIISEIIHHVKLNVINLDSLYKSKICSN